MQALLRYLGSLGSRPGNRASQEDDAAALPLTCEGQEAPLCIALLGQIPVSTCKLCGRQSIGL